MPVVAPWTCVLTRLVGNRPSRLGLGRHGMLDYLAARDLLVAVRVRRSSIGAGLLAHQRLDQAAQGTTITLRLKPDEPALWPCQKP